MAKTRRMEARSLGSWRFMAGATLMMTGVLATFTGAPVSALQAQTEPEGRAAESGERSDPFQLDPILVVGTLEDARLSTGSARVIDGAELRRFEYRNIHSILMSAPGVYVREEDGLGTFPRIGIRASASGRSDRISIMEDGIPAAMAPYANTSAYYFPVVARMSGLEVLKGPEILRYGPQTTSGAINLISTPIPDSTGGLASLETGDWGSRRIHTWAGGSFGSFGVLAETYQNRTDGFHKIDRSSRSAGNDIADYMLKLRWSSDGAGAVRHQLDLKLFKGDEHADVSYLGLTDADFRINPDRRYGLSELERMDRGRESLSLRHRITAGSRFALVTTGYLMDTYRNYTRLNQVNGLPIGGSGITTRINRGADDAQLLQGILDGSANTTHANGVRYGNNFQTFIARGVQLEAKALVRTGSLTHELMGGLRRHEDTARNTATESNIVYEQVNGSLVYQGASAATPSEGFARATSIWVADRIRLGDLTLLPLLRHESVRSRANIDNPESARNELDRTTFGLGTNLGISPRWTVLAGVHQGFAPPGSGAVEGSRGEESTNVEGGVRFRGSTLAVDVVGFYTDYDNALRNCRVANPCADGAVDGVQQDGAKQVYGVETGLSAVVFRAGGFAIPLQLTHTFTTGEYTRSADIASGVQAGDVLDHTPRHVGRLGLGVEHDGGFALNLGLNHSDGACVSTTCGRPGADARFLETESLRTVDLSASYALSSTVEMYARVENLLDERRITHRGSDGARGNPGRYLGTGLRVSF